MYLAAAILAGLTATHNLGEQGTAYLVAAEVQHKSLSAEGSWDSSDKVETDDGWLAHGAADWHTGILTVGAGYSYRQTNAWSKDVWWARVGVQHGPLWLLASVAPASPNMEAKLEARLRCVYGRLVVEERAFVEWHRQLDMLGGGYAYGVQTLIGFGR